ncbi:adenylate/guanylate cyclase domain-containing protein [Aurantimonas sp. VKM B-3413]|uniref:adenylate/guanylate cyclase domain-containing protein n=1 Tax=Aurantimonas sp. VKM B-3413 TaxID=2779401 RepID=UPI001E65A449|nr:adenylate/guanylate cyclase domain-containing protein [Aurantimonas sp. VKM B-3413]MCB8837173.1 adenylate/guanylate cyclase domain-containing protein [Aurantimonas sp. VKM B-3413]
MDRLFQYLNARPIWFAVTVALALALLPVAVWLDLRHLSDVALNAQANSLNAMITDIRSYYAKNVVGRVLANPDGRTVAAHNYADIPGAIPIPATLSLELGEVIGHRGENMRYRFVSDFVFASRQPHRLDGFETDALKMFRSDEGKLPVITAVNGSMFDRKIRLAAPVIMGEACVSCHNTHPESPKRDWKVGDVRGIQEIEVEQPIAANLFSFKYLLTYFAGAGLFGIAFASMQWRQARTFGRMNRELEDANSFLASVSMKISKYLSPQVYRSIFSGERDVVISTERKKLTIFFSDIKDFTVSSERLQPEELTAILNEYFTEMAKIAHEHGATVDKFIGDAILAFFGDPETKGTREDAQACVAMAIAMQRRMVELNAEWRRRGIERPFQARMGINTGFCNVGNFGSVDRMDYTIIGAEANLAARLEQIAEPGGIVMSYETYAHVEDTVRARPLAPISLKGISREVIPYVVENIHEERRTTIGVINEFTDGARIFLDPERVTADERARLQTILSDALDALRKQGVPSRT